MILSNLPCQIGMLIQEYERQGRFVLCPPTVHINYKKHIYA